MKIIVAICIHNRFQNLKQWAKCWHQSNTKNTELVIVHNYYGDQSEKEKYAKYCKEQHITYVPRNGTGFDIGAFQDVCKERLQGFPGYDFLLWCTDDVFPMKKDFISPFIKKLQQPGVGISCMQISASVSPHVRTTGFCLRKETASKLRFPIDPIVTKQHCYFFEHRGGGQTLTNQVRRMGLSCQAVAPIKSSPLWDSFHPNINMRTDRQKEFNHVWEIQRAENKVVFICPVFDAFPEIISSLICQTHKEWQLILIDDNPEETIIKAIVDAVKDNRITYIKRKREANTYGHTHRKWALDEIKEDRLSQNAGFVVVTNADNYYVPTFIQYMLKGFEESHTAVAVFCDQMTHSYVSWGVLQCRFERGYLDCGGVIVKKDIACEVGWRDTKSHSADWVYFQDIANRYNSRNFIPVKGNLFVHN